MVTAVELGGSGRKISARGEIIISAGAYRTPQLLMLSGIGPGDELRCYGINVVLDLPDVGRHFHDHGGDSLWWKLKHPERGLSIGSPASNDPAFVKGNPIDFVVTQPVQLDRLRQALVKDGPNLDPNEHPLVSIQRGHIKTFTICTTSNPQHPTVNMDGSHITTSVVCMLPTSRDSITLANPDPHSAPVIHPNYFATEADRYMLRKA
ncbi:hypothetical protein BDV23DRAFT_178329 [Aspergillus alliaceus]|uniref:Glucose-methanol-choline oxidoreductase N-terminal domain-containing protein n=1 Tax=Petromyces alliaceus TaxID=209559 RepID=A0A5N7CNS2_PETAA|nr:hypothetical protein BDV23DRAFT_178329 [Aspergillus alliaceus]